MSPKHDNLIILQFTKRLTYFSLIFNQWFTLNEIKNVQKYGKAFFHLKPRLTACNECQNPWISLQHHLSTWGTKQHGKFCLFSEQTERGACVFKQQIQVNSSKTDCAAAAASSFSHNVCFHSNQLTIFLSQSDVPPHTDQLPYDWLSHLQLGCKKKVGVV